MAFSVANFVSTCTTASMCFLRWCFLPLRERREDIPALVAHFVDIYSRRMGKQINQIPPESMSARSVRTSGLEISASYRT